MSEYLDFYAEKKFCANCHQYVPYLASMSRSYCAICGQQVNLFSKEDWQKFRRGSVKTQKKTTFIVSKKSIRSLEEDH
ncbi:MAG: hypothetical protein HY286_15970 [Planctomycetes bacterium]|nr:hypothetical protein [Planctomycetota bacterium]